MAKRKKKAWNMSNPLYRYLHGKKKVRTKAKTRHLRGVSMARRRSHRSVSGSSRSFMNKGLYSPKGILASALVGAGAATLAEKVLPQVIPYQGAVIGFSVGGIGGAVGAVARDALKPKMASAVNYQY